MTHLMADQLVQSRKAGFISPERIRFTHRRRRFASDQALIAADILFMARVMLVL